MNLTQSKLLKTILSAFVATSALSACNSNDYAQYNENSIVNFSQFGVTRLDVAKVTVDDQYVPPLRSPNVEHEFNIPLYRAVRSWSDNRLQAVGTGGEAHVIIKEASVKRELGSVDYDKYTAKIVVRLDIESPYYAPEAYAEVTVTQTSSLPSDASDDQRNAFYDQMTNQVITTLNTKMTESINKNLYPVIR